MKNTISSHQKDLIYFNFILNLRLKFYRRLEFSSPVACAKIWERLKTGQSEVI